MREVGAMSFVIVTIKYLILMLKELKRFLIAVNKIVVRWLDHINCDE